MLPSETHDQEAHADRARTARAWLYVAERLEPYAGIRAPAYTVVDFHFYQPLGRLAQLHLKLENAFDTVYATSSLFAARAGNFPGQPRTFSALFTIGAFR